MSNEYKTFNEWKALGRSVIRGEKSTRIDGKCVFLKSQTGIPSMPLSELYPEGDIPHQCSDQQVLDWLEHGDGALGAYGYKGDLL